MHSLAKLPFEGTAQDAYRVDRLGATDINLMVNLVYSDLQITIREIPGRFNISLI